MLETARCSRCLVYAQKSEILLASDGTTYCVVCGPPKLAAPDEWVAPPGHANAYARALASFGDRRTRIVAAAIALVILASFIAACASQT
jgi:hypothetical protein